MRGFLSLVSQPTDHSKMLDRMVDRKEFCKKHARDWRIHGDALSLRKCHEHLIWTSCKTQLTELSQLPEGVDLEQTMAGKIQQLEAIDLREVDVSAANAMLANGLSLVAEELLKTATYNALDFVEELRCSPVDMGLVHRALMANVDRSLFLSFSAASRFSKDNAFKDVHAEAYIRRDPVKEARAISEAKKSLFEHWLRVLLRDFEPRDALELIRLHKAAGLPVSDKSLLVEKLLECIMRDDYLAVQALKGMEDFYFVCASAFALNKLNVAQGLRPEFETLLRREDLNEELAANLQRCAVASLIYGRAEIRTKVKFADFRGAFSRRPELLLACYKKDMFEELPPLQPVLDVRGYGVVEAMARMRNGPITHEGGHPLGALCSDEERHAAVWGRVGRQALGLWLLRMEKGC